VFLFALGMSGRPRAGQVTPLPPASIAHGVDMPHYPAPLLDESHRRDLTRRFSGRVLGRFGPRKRLTGPFPGLDSGRGGSGLAGRPEVCGFGKNWHCPPWGRPGN